MIILVTARKPQIPAATVVHFLLLLLGVQAHEVLEPNCFCSDYYYYSPLKRNGEQ